LTPAAALASLCGIMSRAFNETVIALFSEGMHRFPSLRAAEAPPGRAFPGGERTYRWDGAGGSAWLALILSSKERAEFNVEVGWSCLGRYPELFARPNHSKLAEVCFDTHPEGFVRLRPQGSPKALWWRVSNRPHGLFEFIPEMDDAQCCRLAPPLVADALEQVETVGIPFLENFLQRQRRPECR